MINWLNEQASFTESELARLKNPAVTEPFHVPRSTSRMLFDFAVLAACLTTNHPELPILDFGAGSGWITELLARMGKRVVAFDIHGDLKACLSNRIQADGRLSSQNIGFEHGDGHAMPFANASFSNIVCFDTLHHMHDYKKVFSEFARTLAAAGRAVFVEPGARHSKSYETIAFLNEQKAHDPTWIERDVVLEEIDKIARDSGFTRLTIVPMPHLDQLNTFDLASWRKFRAGTPSIEKTQLRKSFCDNLAKINYDDRVIFYVARL